MNELQKIKKEIRRLRKMFFYLTVFSMLFYFASIYVKLYVPDYSEAISPAFLILTPILFGLAWGYFINDIIRDRNEDRIRKSFNQRSKS